MKRLGIIFGGKSSEHEVSVLSASSVINVIDKSEYEVLQIGIGRDGNWYLIADRMDDIVSLDDPRVHALIPSNGREREGAVKADIGNLKDSIDFAFPVLHGPFGEDGTIQGLFEMLGIPYAGCGVMSSAVSMDKIMTKEVWMRAGLPVCKHGSVDSFVSQKDRKQHLMDVADKLGYPMFVKPANMGSSVGISRVNDMEELLWAVENALNYDHRVIIEEEVCGREFETAVLGNNTVVTASVGEVVFGREFYDYESKYEDGTVKLSIPADIPQSVRDEIRLLAVKAFTALDGKGFARVDFFREEGSGRILLNEMNTIPGFTKYSMFPALWKDAGVEYGELIERIIELGYERYNAKNNRQED